MHPVIAALLTVPPARPEAFGLLAELLAEPDQLTVETLIHSGAEIQAAEAELAYLAYRSDLAVRRCLMLKPVAAPDVPVGF